ncbi:MAG: S8 family serine peptidase [Defluviitaleaceae bacterium]|nr:S8 family serine peptidase [Defluviitaleaceae bacterium]
MKKRFFVIIVYVFLIALVPVTAIAADTLSAEVHNGLIGFEGEYTLTDDSSPVSVIVLFQNNPAEVQVFESQITVATAEKIVEDDHVLFRRELDALFGGVQTMSQGYEIQWEYRRALNGVSLTLPSDMVAELVNFKSVRAVFPNEIIKVEPPQEEIFPQSMDRNPRGVAAGRASMRADEMHALGYRGEGVLIAVLDTGIDLTHPAFEGAFPSLAEIQARNPEITAKDAIDGIFYGRNFYPDDVPTNDPNETIGITRHGTHVAGIIVGRDTGEEVSMLGVAPAAQVISYRVLGPERGTTDTVLAGIEKTMYDRPDVVNMSLGARINSPVCVIALAVNNVMLAQPNITFSLSAGNDRRFGFYSLTTPAPSSMAITVGSAILNPTRLSSFSSVGPVRMSYEIKPDIIAHGSSVFSAVPHWSSSTGYSYLSGTSMAAPHIAGAAALLIDYSGKNSGTVWDSEEIKTRIMNTAIPMEGYSVFEVGAGYVDVFAAAHAETVVYVHNERIATSPDAFDEQYFFTADTGSFSFGSHVVNSDGSPEIIHFTLNATIETLSPASLQYTLAYEFTNNPNNVASLSLEKNIYDEFSATLSIPNNAPPGFYEGFIYVKNNGETVAALPFAFVILVEEPPIIDINNIPDGYVGFPYQVSFNVISSTPLTRYEIVEGKLPTGLFFHYWESLDGFKRLNIEGTPLETGEFRFIIMVENAGGSEWREITIEVYDNPPDPPVITVTELPNGSIGEFYSAYIKVYSEADLQHYSMWNLPPGLELSRVEYEDYFHFFIEGTPTQNGIFYFHLSVSNDFGYGWELFTIRIGSGNFTPEPPFINAGDFPAGWQGIWYNKSFWTDGTPPLNRSITAGSLPPGLRLSGHRIFGFPTETGTFNFTITVSNNWGTDSQEFIIEITEPAAPFITQTTLESGAQGDYYWQKISVTGTLSIFCSITEGSLPPGLVMDRWGVVIGTPTTQGEFTFTVRAYNPWGSDSAEITLTIGPPRPPVIVTANFSNGAVGDSYHRTIWLSQGTPPLTWSITDGKLPPGLALDDGVISGTPTELGLFIFTIKVENIGGYDTQEFTIEIVVPAAPVITTTELRNGNMYVSYSDEIVAVSNVPVTWSLIEGILPPGMWWDTWNSDARILGTPTALGEFTFTFRVENPAGYDTVTLTINIFPATDITSAFECPKFLERVRIFLQKHNNEPVYAEQMTRFTELSLCNRNITSLAGIEYFVNLEQLSASGNLLTHLDLSHNTKLWWVYIEKNRLQTLNVQGASELMMLLVNDNWLAELDISSNHNLSLLDVRNNFISDVDAVIGWRDLFSSYGGCCCEGYDFMFLPQRPAAKRELALLIHYAETLAANTAVSADGKNVLAGSYWATSHDHQVFQAAILDAWDAYNNA